MTIVKISDVFRDPVYRNMLFYNSGIGFSLTTLDGKKFMIKLHDHQYNALRCTDQRVIYDQLLEKFEDNQPIETSLKKRITTIQTTENKALFNTLNRYANAMGISAEFLDRSNLPDLKVSTNTLQEIAKSFLQYKEQRETEIRMRVAQSLKSQENQIMANIPELTLNNPEKLRPFLVEQLNFLGLTYNSAIQQFYENKKTVVESSYVLCKLIAQCDAWSALRSCPKGENIPFDAVWRASIDGSCEKYGAYYFENEPFYILSMLRGLAECLNNDMVSLEGDNPLTQADYETFASALLRNPPIHKKNTELGCRKYLDSPLLSFECRMVNNVQRFDIEPWKKDEIGIKDLKERSKVMEAASENLKQSTKNDIDYWIAQATGFKFDGKVVWHHSEKPFGMALITYRIFSGLHRMLQHAKTPGKRLIAYIWAARELEVCHLMGDGNGRTAIHSLIKWIAKDNELPLYIPEDPNILDLQGPEKLIRDIHSGMKRLAEMSGEEMKDFIDVETLIEQAGVKGKGWEEVHQRAELPDEEVLMLLHKYTESK